MSEGKKLTWAEIESQYDGQWVLLDDFDWPDEAPDPYSGVVILHSPDRKEFDQKMLEMKAVNVARLFVGKPNIPHHEIINCNLVNITYADN